MGFWDDLKSKFKKKLFPAKNTEEEIEELPFYVPINQGTLETAKDNSEKLTSEIEFSHDVDGIEDSLFEDCGFVVMVTNATERPIPRNNEPRIDREAQANQPFDLQDYIDNIHPSIKDLVYVEKQRPTDWEDEDPGAIYLNLKVRQPEKYDHTASLGYYPSYTHISPGQRFLYLKFLSNPFSEDEQGEKYEIGYVFMLLYSLERRLYDGDYLSAFDVIDKLMDIYDHPSFRYYANRAIFFTCVNRGDDEPLKKLICKHGCDKLSFSLYSFLYLKRVLCEKFTVTDFYQNKKYFGEEGAFTSKKEDEYIESLRNKMILVFGSDEIDLEVLYEDALLLPRKSHEYCYENAMLRERKIEIVDMEGVPIFRDGCIFCLQEANKDFKKPKWSKPTISKEHEIYKHHGCQLDEYEELFYRMLVEYSESKTDYTIKDVYLKRIGENIIEFGLSYHTLGRINFVGAEKKVSVMNGRKQEWIGKESVYEALEIIPIWVDAAIGRELRR